MATKRKSTKRKSTKSSKSRSSSSFSGKLARSKSDKMVAGVLGGLAAYFKVDSTILRLVWIAIVAFTGFIPGILAYALAAIVIPEK